MCNILNGDKCYGEKESREEGRGGLVVMDTEPPDVGTWWPEWDVHLLGF